MGKQKQLFVDVVEQQLDGDETRPEHVSTGGISVTITRQLTAAPRVTKATQRRAAALEGRRQLMRCAR